MSCAARSVVLLGCGWMLFAASLDSDGKVRTRALWRNGRMKLRTIQGKNVKRQKRRQCECFT
jgi:hypothetical protein